MRAWLGCLFALFISCAHAQVTPGTSPLTIPKGGTGAATASAARANLGVPGIPVTLANGGLGGSQSAATANQVPVYPGSGGAAVPTFIITAINTACSFLPSACTSLFGYANPIWWGADPTGSVDSTSAINSAVTAANGGKVQLPSGVFKATAQITIGTSSTQIVGTGRLSTIIRTTQTAANVFNVTASYVRISNLAIVGTTGQVATAGAAINVAAGNYNGGEFSNLYISDLFDGIIMSGVSGWKINFVKMVNIYGQYGLLMSGGGGNYVNDNQFDPLFWTTTVYSITSGYGAWVTSHAYAAGAVVIVNGGIFACQTAGTSSSTGTGPVITAFGTLIDDGTAQWYFLGASNSVGISIQSVSNSNFVRHTDVSGPWTSGVQVIGSDGNVIDNLTIGQTIGSGVQLQTGATNTDIINSIFDGMLYTFGLGVVDNNGSANGTRVISNQFNGSGWYCILIQGSTNWIVADNSITGCGNITSAPAIGIGSGSLKVHAHDNVIISTAGMSSGITASSGASDYLSIHDNNLQTASLSYAATGTHNVVRSNLGYNPVGLTAGTSTGTSASTITAGPSPETHYITQSATFNAAVKSGATTLCTVATATVPCVIQLDPNESYSVTWATTQPTYSKFVH